jgi:flagellar motor component MotA
MWYNITNKEVIGMTRDDFIAEYCKVSSKVVEFSEKSRREGLLVLEDVIDFEKINQRDILEYGLRFVIDGTDPDTIKEILSLIIEQEDDKYARRLMELKKTAVLSIQAGDNPRILAYKLNAFTDLILTDDPIIQKINDDENDKGKFTEEEINVIIERLN